MTDSDDDTLTRIVLAGEGVVTDPIALGNGPAAIAAGAGAIWVANSRDGTVSRINPATRAVDARIEVGRLPSGIAVGAGAVWVANSLSGTVSRIDPRDEPRHGDDRRRRARPVRSRSPAAACGSASRAAPPESGARRAGRRWRAC